jgi:hypothetical protein
MLAQTPRGKEVRRYFLDCEAELKRRIQEEQQNSKSRQVKVYVVDKALPWNSEVDGPKPFSTEFYQHLYRIRGGAWASRNASEPHRPSCVGSWTTAYITNIKSLRCELFSVELLARPRFEIIDGFPL